MVTDSAQLGLKILITRKKASVDNTIYTLYVQHLIQNIWSAGMEGVRWWYKEA